jgi:hypothetical protein
MSVTITAIAGPTAPGSDLTAQQALQEFVVSLQSSAASGMPQLANPAALASELSGYLRGYVERAQNVQRAMRTVPSVDGDGASLVQTATSDQSRPDLHGGPARERLEPAGAGVDGGLSSAARANLAQLERLHALMVAQMESILEGTLLTSGTSQVIRSFESLLRGQ